MRRLAKAKSAPRDEVQQRVRYWQATGAERGTPGEGNWWPQAEQLCWPGMPQALAHAPFLWPGGSCDLGGVLGVVLWLTASARSPQPDPHPHPAAAVGGARGPRLPGLTSWPGSGNPQSIRMALGFWGLARMALRRTQTGQDFPFSKLTGARWPALRYFMP